MKSLTLIAVSLLVALAIAETATTADQLKGVGTACAAGDDKTCTDVNTLNCCSYNTASKTYVCQNKEVVDLAYNVAIEAGVEPTIYCANAIFTKISAALFGAAFLSLFF